MTTQLDLLPELASSAPFMMGLAYKQFRTLANQVLLCNYDITVEMLGALRVLKHLGQVPQQSLASNLRRERSATKRLVDNCIKRELISVHKCDNNKKARYLALTDKGINILTIANAALQAQVDQFYAPLSDAEQASLLELCKKLVRKDIILAGDEL